MPSFLECPRCRSGDLRQDAVRLACAGCGQSFPMLQGIIDFRDTRLDATAAFSIADDRMLAGQLSLTFEKATTFNELHDFYRYLAEQHKRGVPPHIAAEGLFAKAAIGPRPLGKDQLAHGKAILDKIPQYNSATPHAMPADGIALENGCGLGLFIDGFAAHFKKLVVLDFSLCYLLLAKKLAEERNLNNVTLICGSVECLPLKADTFDFIHSNNVIEHISNQRSLFTEASRVLNENGLFFVLSPNRFSSYFEPHFRLPFFGFIPKAIRKRIIRMRQNRSIDEISLLSLGELRTLAAGVFGKNIAISFIPRHLSTTATGGFIRNTLVRGLNSRFLGAATDLLVNKLLLGVMPYHVALCRKGAANEHDGSRRMKICVVMPRFAIAGVPLAQLRFARALAGNGHDVDLVVGYVDPAFELPAVPGVNVLIWKQPRVRGMLAPLWRYLRAAKPDVVFSAEDHLNAIVLLAAIGSGSKAKISGSSRVTPFDTYSNAPFTKRWALKLLARAVMWRADALTCVSKDMVEQYGRMFNAPPHVCAYNIVDDASSRLRMREPAEHEWLQREGGPVLVAAGRLAAWKGFADLIRAMKELSRSRKARLMILGDGPLREELQALIVELGLSDTVKLLGYVANPLKFFARADVFVLSSHVEGLPNVLVEAMMCGCTPVSTDCPTGPREVLHDGKYGYLVPMRDPVAMAAGIEKALDKPISKSLLAEAVRPFEETAVLRRHFELLGLPFDAGAGTEKLCV